MSVIVACVCSSSWCCSQDRKKLKLAITEAEKLGLDMELKAARDYLRRLATVNVAGKDGEEFDEASQPLEYLPLRTGSLMKRGVGVSEPQQQPATATAIAIGDSTVQRSTAQPVASTVRCDSSRTVGSRAA